MFVSEKYTYTDDIHEKPFQGELFEVKTTPSRDKLLMTLLGVGVDQLNDIYKKRKGRNPDVDKIVLSKGDVKLFDSSDDKLTKLPKSKIIEFHLMEAISSNSINVLRREFGFSYKPDIKYQEDEFTAKWSEVSNDYEIRKLLDGKKSAPNQKHYFLKNGNELHDRVMDLLNWGGDKDYISLVFIFPFKSKVNIDDGSEIRWDIFDGTMSRECKQIDKYALMLAIQLLYVNKNDNTLCRNIIDNSFMKSDFINQDVLDYTVLAKSLNMSGLKNSKSEKGQIIQTKISPEKNLVDFKYKRILYNNNAKKRKDLETICDGLKLLMSNTPGIACKLNIPASEEFKELNKSGTWVFGPSYWIQFLENSNSTAKQGSIMRKQSMELDDNGLPKSAIYYC